MAVAHRRHLGRHNRAAHLKPRSTRFLQLVLRAPIPSAVSAQVRSPSLELRSLGYELTLVGTSCWKCADASLGWGSIHGKSLFYIEWCCEGQRGQLVK